MSANRVRVERLPSLLKPDPRRVIARFFGADQPKARRRAERVAALPLAQARDILATLRLQYRSQHPDLDQIWLEHFQHIAHLLPHNGEPLTQEHKLLIGAYFTMDYAIESAALFNPSIIPLPRQDGLPEGATRFLMSLRATGEGHLSSLVFRTGVVDADNQVYLDEPRPTTRPLKQIPDAEYDTTQLRQTLRDLGVLGPVAEKVLDAVGPSFSLGELNDELERARPESRTREEWEHARDNLFTLTRSNYRLEVPDGADPAEIVIFPVSQNESHGIEDLRLTRFTDDSGSVHIYGCYTAFNGHAAFPSLLHTRDLRLVESHTMAGAYARNKGMALFPRGIGGRYVMSGRVDGENLYILESNNLLVWNEARLSARPQYPWEFTIIGNCGSPLETPEGWLLLTHGVGPMRQYCIAAMLLDLEDPAKVIGRLKEPLLMPAGDERVGYVPNVVYTCGSMLHNQSLIIPYAVSDIATSFACVDLDEMMAALKR